MRFRALAVLVVLVLGLAIRISAQDPRQLALEAAQRIKQLQAEADRLAYESSTILSGLRRLELQRQIKTEELKQANAELAAVEAAIERTTTQLAALEAERERDRPWVRAHLVELYKRGRASYLQRLLATDDVRSMVRLGRGVAAMMMVNRMRLEAHRETVRRHRAALDELQAQREQADAARAAAQRARAELAQAVAAYSRRLDELDRERDGTARFIGELQAAQQELQRSMAAMPAGTAPATLPITPFKGALDWPVAGRLLSTFGRSAADRFGGALTRNGIEIATEEGAPVHAVHAGTVTYAAPFSGFGTLVVVDHGRNAFTLYGHLGEAAVTKGTTVGRNQVVGRAGRTPDGVAAAYFELRVDGRPVDPIQWLRSQR
jgi:septal ring factor EnvC (AmiA/AmiB activator)